MERTLLNKVMGLALMAAGAACAQQTTVVLDPAQTRVDFTLSTTLHTVHGAFHLKSGTIRFDPATGRASGSVIVDARSGESGSSGRDRRMHQNVLGSERYPDITFAPDRIQGPVALSGPSTVQVHGVFTVHGTPHELTLGVQVEFGPSQLSANLHFVVPYQNWGMKNPSTFLLRVGDKVDIAIHAAGHIVPAAATR
jgi:polyisoprenoid-binding protein YceI